MILFWKVFCWLLVIEVSVSLSLRIPNKSQQVLMNGVRQQASEFPESILEFDHYDGVIVALDKFEGDFEAALFHQLEIWKGQSKRGVWLHVPSTKASFVETACRLGFTFHSVKNGTLILTQWLANSPSRLPSGPLYQLGVGCLLFHPEDEPGLDRRMLVVKEKSGPAKAYDLWKMPTGLLDEGENIQDACLRELQEETGLNGSTFEGILNFRQAHRRSVSDLFFVCQMRLEELQEFQICEVEILDIQWMKTRDFLNQDRWLQSPIYRHLNSEIALAAKDEAALWQETTLPIGPDLPTNTVFSPSKYS